MILIEEILISDDIHQVHFSCDVKECKGACCWEGDFGAPLEREEIGVISDLMDKIKPLVRPEAQAKIDKVGVSVYYDEIKKQGTPLLEGGACVYLVEEQPGFAQCVFEQEFDKGNIEFRKPISCHLYPLRIEKNEHTGFHSINYDKWDICKPALAKGKKDNTPLYLFVKEALVHNYGADFYNQLEATIEKITS